jgi:hypothetical protein
MAYHPNAREMTMDDLSSGESAMAGLGGRVAVHEGTLAGGGWLWYIGAISLLAGVAWLVRPAKAIGRSAVGTSPMERIALALIALVVGAVCTLVATYRWQQTVEVYEQGFLWRRMGGSTTVHRSEMSAATKVVQVSRVLTVVSVEVSLRDGRELTLRGFADPDKLVADLRALLPPAHGKEPS